MVIKISYIYYIYIYIYIIIIISCYIYIYSTKSERKKEENKRMVGWFVGWLVFGFYGISTFVGYLTPNPFLYKSSVPLQTIQFSMTRLKMRRLKKLKRF